jgi:hypothetical protein
MSYDNYINTLKSKIDVLSTESFNNMTVREKYKQIHILRQEIITCFKEMEQEINKELKQCKSNTDCSCDRCYDQWIYISGGYM